MIESVKTEILNSEPVKMVAGKYRVTLELNYADIATLHSLLVKQAVEFHTYAKSALLDEQPDIRRSLSEAGYRYNLYAEATNVQHLIESKKLTVGKSFARYNTR
jgi:hypothetical protein